MAGKNVEVTLRIFIFTLVMIFKLRQGITRKKLQLFFSAVHYLRKVREYVVNVEVGLHQVPIELLIKIWTYHERFDSNIDFGNVLIVSSHSFPNLKTPKWILAKGSVIRWVFVVAFPIKGMAKKALGSPQLQHNLIKSHFSKDESTPVKLFLESCGKIEKLYAKEIQIALVDSLIDTSQFDVKLRELFSDPKYVQVGDFIADNHIAFIVKSIKSFEEKKIHIGSIAEYGRTFLFQVTSEPALNYVTNFKEKNDFTRHHLYSYSKIMNCLIPIRPYGLSMYCETICNLCQPYIQTFLQSKAAHNGITPSILLEGPPGSGKRTIVKSVALSLGLKYIEISCTDFLSESSKAAEIRMQNAFVTGRQSSPAVLYLTDLEVVGRKREENTRDHRISRYFVTQIVNSVCHAIPYFVIGGCHSSSKCSADVYAAFLHKISVDNVSNEMRSDMIRWILEEKNVMTKIPLDVLGKKTQGFHFGDLNTLISIAIRDAILNPQRGEQTSASFIIPQASIDHALDKLRLWQSDSINAPQIPEVHWEDIGGLHHVIGELLDTIQLPLKYPQLIANGLRRSGILLYGPPGTGKTLLAKAVATECSLHFLSVKGPELLNMYIGQSEENVRQIFQSARDASPCLIFFDELDSLAPNRGRSGDSGGVMDRVVSQLLAELDGINKSASVFVIGATNRPDLIDPALLRPGRFDKLIFLGVNDTKENQVAVLKALTRKFPLDANVNLEDIVSHLPSHLTGADLYSLCSNASLQSMSRCIKIIEAGGELTETDQMLTVEDFLTAANQLIPSISREDLIQYQALQNKIHT